MPCEGSSKRCRSAARIETAAGKFAAFPDGGGVDSGRAEPHLILVQNFKEELRRLTRPI